MPKGTSYRLFDHLHEGLSREELDLRERSARTHRLSPKDRRGVWFLAACFVGMLLLGIAVASVAGVLNSEEPMRTSDANTPLERSVILPDTH